MSTARVASARIEPLRLTFREPLRTARATYTARDGFVVRLTDAAGRVGQGEAMPLEEFGTEAPEPCARALARALDGLGSGPLPEGQEALAERLAGLRDTPAARHALEQAVLDLWAQARGVPLARLLSQDARGEVEVNALLSAVEPWVLAGQAASAVAEGYRTLKIKVGGRPLTEDVGRVRAVRDSVGPGVRLRIDANAGWSEAEALDALTQLAPFGLELCEQPVPGCPALTHVARHVRVPLGADECLTSIRAAEELLRAQPVVAALVLKPMVLGGLLPALALARAAWARGVGAYVTSSLDGVVARAGAAHLAAALPTHAHASGLAVGKLFVEEPADHPFAPRNGRIVLPTAPGLGVSP